MGKNRGKITYSIIIINIVLSCAILFFSYQEYTKNKEISIKRNEIEDNYQQVLSNNEDSKSAISEVDEKMAKLQNIENDIQETKKEVFQLASELEQKIRNGQSQSKIAYLTFDDGPYYNTYKVLDILKQHQVKATFFTTNINGEICYDNGGANCHQVYSAIASANHTIANHTYTHGWNRGLYASAASFMDAVKKQETLIYEKTGVTTNIVRFPGGSSTPRIQGGQARLDSMINALRDSHYGWVDWTAQDGDGGSLNDTSTGWRNFTSSIGESIEVVLFHDYNWVTTNLLPNFINYLQDNGYILLPLFYESVMINK